MDDFLKEAIEIVKAQAAVRTMTEEEITSMVRRIAEGIKNIASGVVLNEEPEVQIVEAKAAIKEKSITCLECGKVFKVITKKHLAKHSLTSDEYKTKYSMKRTTPLVCKSLQRERRKRMKNMKLWESRRKNQE
ncbi:Transcriptional regulator [Desulfovibrionales bacterium]